MDKAKIKKKMFEEKQEELFRYEILEEYLKERINQGETIKRNDLAKVQRILTEIKNILEFLK